MELAVAAFLSTQYNYIEIDHVEKENLDLVYILFVSIKSFFFSLQKNHLSGLKSKFIRVSFLSTFEMAHFKRDILAIVQKNRKKQKNTNELTRLISKYSFFWLFNDQHNQSFF